MNHENQNIWYGTTILCLRVGDQTVIAGDGQVSIGQSVVKATANKLRKINKGSIIAGFAGSTADAFTLFERLEAKLETYPTQLQRAAVELAKDWRTDKYLRRLEAMLLVADKKNIFTITGNGDVLEPEGGVAAIGSGGNYALSAARALLRSNDKNKMNAVEIATEAMKIAAELCVYTNGNIVIEKVES